MIWRILLSSIVGINVGAGTIYVYTREEEPQFDYVCTCSTSGGNGPQWSSLPVGRMCPPEGIADDVCP